MSNLNINLTTYESKIVKSIRDELIGLGFKEFFTPNDVDNSLAGKGTVLLFINSICSCTAKNARPGLRLALQPQSVPDQVTIYPGQEKKNMQLTKFPDQLVTILARQEQETVDYIKQKYLFDYIPSAPFMALFNASKVVYVIERWEIEGKPPVKIATMLKAAFEKYC